MDSAVERRRWRREWVEVFLSEIGVAYERLAPQTRRNLDDWARQVQVYLTQRSAGFETVVLELCKAVESELACGLARVVGLEFLGNADTLGTKAHRLRALQSREVVAQRLAGLGFKPGFVLSALPGLLLELARIRSQANVAHGGVATEVATPKDAERTRSLAKRVLKELVRPPGKTGQKAAGR
jgi:hypothetical protein